MTIQSLTHTILSKGYYKKKIIDLRAQLEREREAKKRDNEPHGFFR